MKKYDERVKNIINKKDKLQEKRRQRIRSYGSIGIVSILLAVIIGHQVSIDLKPEITVADNVVLEQAQKNEPLKFVSKKELIQKIKENNEKSNFRWGLTDDLAINGQMKAESESIVSDTAAITNNKDTSYSETNTQVQGVDEADIVKTNGKNIYYLANNKLNILDVNTNEIILEKAIEFNNETNIIEMYLDDNYIIVLSNYYKKNNTNSKYQYISNTFVKTSIYDINTYELVREVETEGYYLSSRKIDNDIYVVTNKNSFSYMFRDENHNDDEYTLPLCKDSVVSNEYRQMEATDIAYFENAECSSFMIITSFSLDKMDSSANIETFLGGGNQIYVSRNSLYVTNLEYSYSGFMNRIGISANDVKTSIHKFEINDGKVNYIATGKVNGTLLNQFSMDEYNNNFRITTTTNGENSKNNIFVLDNNMNTIGKLTGLAKGERIYSTRFMGDKCYVVTYKTVDPLFVIDLSNPQEPKVLGELKIPGYSSYLHPIGENYLLGFGEDTVESTYTNWNGEKEAIAYANGLKIAIFDVTDYNNPKELHSVKLGGRGSYSELLYNHKTLLFDEQRGIIAFPARLCTDNNGYEKSGAPKYGKEEFNGGLVYNFSIENGFELRGKISHENIARIIRVGDKLFTLSNKVIKSSDINTIENISKLNIK